MSIVCFCWFGPPRIAGLFCTVLLLKTLFQSCGAPQRGKVAMQSWKNLRRLSAAMFARPRGRFTGQNRRNFCGCGLTFPAFRAPLSRSGQRFSAKPSPFRAGLLALCFELRVFPLFLCGPQKFPPVLLALQISKKNELDLVVERGALLTGEALDTPIDLFLQTNRGKDAICQGYPLFFFLRIS